MIHHTNLAINQCAAEFLVQKRGAAFLVQQRAHETLADAVERAARDYPNDAAVIFPYVPSWELRRQAGKVRDGA
jgi:hypothetical protein